ncbi:MAG TPA: VIT domain-containing protein [Candidatus Thermoplasmatota archaeon]|nr:VIT domain-containing protein [Candidatus Thermoplasmatota archaeon]
MRRALALLLLATLLVPTGTAQEERPPTAGSVWTVFTTVEATVRDNYATVKVIEDIGNRGPDPEFPFVVRVPDDAFVTGLIIERDGRVWEAEVKDREAAREQYEEWKAQGQTGGLVEKTRRTSVYSYLVNVAEATSVRATLTYERYLAADRGVYDLALEAPVSGFGQDLGARFDVAVKDAEGVTALWGDPAPQRDGERITYSVGPRASEAPTAFTASYTLSPTAEAGSLLTSVVDGKGYFAHRFRAKADAPLLPMDLVLVLDVSGSMAGLKLQQMIDAAKQVVGALHDEDRLQIVAFSSDARSTWSAMRPMTPEARKDAAREIDALFDGGGTNIEAGLVKGFGAFPPAEDRYQALVLLTDGQPTAGLSGRDALREVERDANEQGVNVFGIAFGDDADWGLVRALAVDGEGAAIRVPLGTGAEVDLRRFMAALTTPVLHDVDIAYSDGVKAYHQGAPVLFAGSELLVVGTFDPAKGISGTVQGWTTDGARSWAFDGGDPASLPYLPRVVAYHRVREMQEEDAPDVAAITALAIASSFVTDHTSLVLDVPARTWDGEAWAVDDRSADGCGGNCSMARSYAPWSTSGMETPSDPVPTAAYVVTDSTTDVDGRYAMHEIAASPPAHGSEAPVPATAAPQVPGPGVALIALAVAAIALTLRRR